MEDFRSRRQESLPQQGGLQAQSTGQAINNCLRKRGVRRRWHHFCRTDVRAGAGWVWWRERGALLQRCAAPGPPVAAHGEQVGPVLLGFCSSLSAVVSRCWNALRDLGIC